MQVLGRSLALRACDAVEQRQHERRGFAGAGLGYAQNIAPGEHGWNDFVLDGGRGLVPLGRNGSKDGFG